MVRFWCGAVAVAVRCGAVFVQFVFFVEMLLLKSVPCRSLSAVLTFLPRRVVPLCERACVPYGCFFFLCFLSLVATRSL